MRFFFPIFIISLFVKLCYLKKVYNFLLSELLIKCIKHGATDFNNKT